MLHCLVTLRRTAQHCHVTLSCYNITAQHCRVTMSCYNVMLHCHVTLPCCTAMLHCHVTLSCYTKENCTTLSCYAVMLQQNCTTLSCYNVMLHCHGALPCYAVMLHLQQNCTTLSCYNVMLHCHTPTTLCHVATELHSTLPHPTAMSTEHCMSQHHITSWTFLITLWYLTSITTGALILEHNLNYNFF